MAVMNQWNRREAISKILIDSGKAHNVCNEILELQKQASNSLYRNDETTCYECLAEIMVKVGYIHDYLDEVDEQAMELLNDTVVV